MIENQLSSISWHHHDAFEEVMQTDLGWHMMDFDHMWGPGIAVWGTLMAIFWVLIIIGIILLIRWIIQDNKNSNKTNDTIKILDKRLARGEVDKEEYERKKSKLEEGWEVNVMIGLWILGIIVLYLILRDDSISVGNNNGSKTALEILDERYDGGEINSGEYERRKRILKE